MKGACYSLLGFVVVYGVCLFFSSIFFCVPLQAFWDESITGYCLPHSLIWFLNASINITTDLSIFLLPTPVINTLVLPKRQKFGLYIVFGLGFFVCIISILRLHALHITASSTDPTWDNIGISSVEINMAIICPSLTTLKPLVSRVFPRLFLNSATPRLYDQQDKGFDLNHSTRSRKQLGASEPSDKPAVADQSYEDTLHGQNSFELAHLEVGLARVGPQRDVKDKKIVDI